MTRLAAVISRASSPETFEAQGCEGVLKFGVSMVCVLWALG